MRNTGDAPLYKRRKRLVYREEHRRHSQIKSIAHREEHRRRKLTTRISGTMTKIRDKDRRSNRIGKFNSQRSFGLEELKGYVFAHGDHGAGSKFNKTVEKIADYCRVEVSKEIYKLILYGEEAEFPEVEEPSGSKPSSAKMKKFEMDYKRRLEKLETYGKKSVRLLESYWDNV